MIILLNPFDFKVLVDAIFVTNNGKGGIHIMINLKKLNKGDKIAIGCKFIMGRLGEPEFILANITLQKRD